MFLKFNAFILLLIFLIFIVDDFLIFENIFLTLKCLNIKLK